MATVITNAAQQSNALVWASRLTSGGQPRYMAAKTGGGVSSDSSVEYDGGSKIPEVSTAPAVTENIVTTLRYKPALDHAMLKSLKAQCGVFTDTLNLLDTDADFKPIPGVEPDVYPNATLVGVGGIDVDRNSNTTRTCQLTWAVSTLA